MAAVDDYKAIIQKFIRPGRAWNGEKFTRLIGTLGMEFGRIEHDLETVEDERNISQALVMLEDFEKEYFKSPNTDGQLQDRRNRVLAKERAKGEASQAYLTNVIEAFGYKVVNWQRHRPTRSGQMRSGSHLTSLPWVYTMRITLDPTPVNNANYNNMLAALKEVAHANMIFIFE